MALGDVFELGVRQSLFGIQVVNVWHFRDETGAGDAQHLADDFGTSAFMTTWRGYTSIWLQFIEVATRQIYPFVLNAGSHPLNFTGTTQNQPLAPVVAAVITWTTGVRGKRYRGRSYLAGHYGGMSQGTWDGQSMQTLSTLAGTMLDCYGEDGTNATYRLGVWSRKNGVIDPTTTSPAGFTPVVSAIARAYVCSMGTRRAGHGV